jgi:hypothetical protein
MKALKFIMGLTLIFYGVYLSFYIDGDYLEMIVKIVIATTMVSIGTFNILTL